jgi:hypothetical protein
MTVVAIVSTLAVTAVLVGSFQGGEVTIGGVASSTVTYSPDNALPGTWTTTLESGVISDPWYARLEIGAGSYSGPVTVTWQLQQKTGSSTWTDVGTAQTTTMVLAGTAENVYASSDGGNSNNYDWSTDASAAGTYRVDVTVESA